ncbi:MAG: response regulator, partial [Polaromonas sp.]
LAPPAALPEPHIPHARLIDIVEPDPRAAGALTRRLGQSGYRTRVFDKPSLLAASPADGATAAILANMDLPEDQLQILRALARSYPHEESEVPLIFMARERDFHARLSAVRAGGVGYFPQPVDVRSLLNLLDRVTSDEPSRPYRVLIIEDDENLGAFYAEVLHSAGIVTSVVTDPAAVTGLLTSFRPDLITCDIYMPECNGIELAALIRQQEEFVRIPIVFLSIETSLDKQSHALRQGGDDFIIKPVQPANLISAVQSKARRYRTLLAAEDTLRISDERFRLVFETSLDGFIQTLADGTIVSANQAACNMFEMTEQELRHIGLAGIVDNANLGLHILQGMQGRTGKYRGEFICIRASGLRFPAEISASQHVSGNGDIQGSIILRDISARKVAEEKVMQLNAELEDRVARRTAELTAANLELRAFSHSMAHDLRQPYIAINGLASLMEREIADHLTERGKHYLSRIRACVHQMNECTDSLLSLAQLSQTTTYREKVDLAALCNTLLADLQLKEPERIVQIQVQTPLEADGDAKLLLHLLRNLLGNAWKFTSRQDEAVIDVSSQAGPDGKTVYCIRDNGAGFDMTYADNLFGAFQRL